MRNDGEVQQGVMSRHTSREREAYASVFVCGGCAARECRGEDLSEDVETPEFISTGK